VTTGAPPTLWLKTPGRRRGDLQVDLCKVRIFCWRYFADGAAAGFGPYGATRATLRGRTGS
jgi:hypothetical protein